MKKILLLLVFVCSQALGQTITISSPAANYNICQATNFNIAFSASGFNAGNVFTAEISGFNGAFIIPITAIGSLSGTNSGTIVGNIPNSLFASTNYLIRIKSSNPEVTSDVVGIRVGVVEPYLYLQNGYAGYQYACASGGGLLVNIIFQFNYDPVSDFTFVWKKNNVNITALNQSGSAPFAFGRLPVLSQSDAGAYKLEITNNNGNCTVITNTQNVLIANAYAAPTTVNQTIASGSTATLTASNCAGTVYWYNVSTPPNLSHLATGTFTTPVLTQTTTYYAACGDTPWCFSLTTPLTVTVTQQPPTQPANFTTSTSSLCQGQSNVIYTVPNVSGVTYNWTYSGTGAAFSSTTNSVSINFANNATSGILSVTATNSAGTSPARTLAVTVNQNPAPSASGVTIASGSTASITATGCTTYKWYNLSTAGTLLFTGNPFVTPALTTNTTYYMACSDAPCPESSRTAVLVTVTTGPPQPGPITGSSSACQGRLGLNYSITAVAGATSYTWTYSGTGVSFVGGVSNTANITLDFSFAATAGTLSVTANNASGSSPATTLAISINAAPAAPTASGVTIAQGSTANLTATGCLIYKWYATSTPGTTALFTGQNFTTPPLTATTNYYVACNPGYSCDSPRILVTVTVPCTQMYTLKAGTWNDASVWSCNRIPIATDNITVEFGHIVSVPAGTFPVKKVTEKGTLSFLPSGILRIVGGL